MREPPLDGASHPCQGQPAKNRSTRLGSPPALPLSWPRGHSLIFVLMALELAVVRLQIRMPEELASTRAIDGKNNDQVQDPGHWGCNQLLPRVESDSPYPTELR
ncbi:hypothetical protein CapIbe_009840 [Capra ibex]